MASVLHPQTLLCYEMNRAPLSLENGAPLRLVIATKYGIKNIKRIGTITYTDQRPPDYWAEQGYDSYAGLSKLPAGLLLTADLTEIRQLRLSEPCSTGSLL